MLRDSEEAGEALNSTDIIAALHKLWPDGDYVKVEEAPDSSDRMGRKIDLLAISAWRSRGFEVSAVEVKVSMADAKRELADAAKADFWWRHSDRFWLAVPESMFERVMPDVPETWGLMAVGEKCRVVIQAPKHKREPLPWHTCIGVMRAGQQCGVNALARARMEGRNQAVQEAGAREERGYRYTSLKATHDELVRLVAEFQTASGVTIEGWRAKDIGNAVKIVLERESCDRVLESAMRLRDRLTTLVDAATPTPSPPVESLPL